MEPASVLEEGGLEEAEASGSIENPISNEDAESADLVRATDDSTEAIPPEETREETQVENATIEPVETPEALPAIVEFKLKSTPVTRIEIQLDGQDLKTPLKKDLSTGSHQLVCDPRGASISATIEVPAEGGTWICNTTKGRIEGP